MQAHFGSSIPSILRGTTPLCAPNAAACGGYLLCECASTAERFCYRKKLSRISVIMSFLEHNRIERDNYPALSKHLRIQRSSPSSICKSAYYSSSAAASSSADFSSADVVASSVSGSSKTSSSISFAVTSSSAFILRLIFFSSPLKSTTLA